jgi:cytochrome c oxidase subunit IV
LLSSTLKVQGSKVVLFFSYLAFWAYYGGFLVHSLNILLKISSGAGTRRTFFMKIAQKSLSYTYENIFRPLVSNFEKNVD